MNVPAAKQFRIVKGDHEINHYQRRTIAHAYSLAKTLLPKDNIFRIIHSNSPDLGAGDL
jgi:hypothetical protein